MEIWTVCLAIVSASLLGSMHCVGMCGPLALWSCGCGQPASSRGEMLLASTCYHGGRLVTYVLVGIIAGGLGQLLDVGGGLLGIQLVAARVVGALMILIGVLQFLRIWKLKRLSRSTSNSQANAPLVVVAPHGAGEVQTACPSKSKSDQTSLGLRMKLGVAKLLGHLRPKILALPALPRALGTGLLTPLLPCGWLYLFALVAAGTSSYGMGGLIMACFWIGTVPALSAMVWTTNSLGQRFRTSVPAMMSIALIVTGWFAVAGRGFAQLNSLNDIQISVPGPQPGMVVASPAPEADQSSGQDILQQLEQVDDAKLPCCQAH